MYTYIWHDPPRTLPCIHTAYMCFNVYVESLPMPSPEPGVNLIFFIRYTSLGIKGWTKEAFILKGWTKKARTHIIIIGN